MTDEYVLRSSVLKSIHNGDIDMGIVTTHEYYLLRKLSKKIDRRIQRVPAANVRPVVLCRYCCHREECAFDADDNFFCASGEVQRQLNNKQTYYII